jgi:predicted DNA repair protein MutK
MFARRQLRQNRARTMIEVRSAYLVCGEVVVRGIKELVGHQILSDSRLLAFSPVLVSAVAWIHQ